MRVVQLPSVEKVKSNNMAFQQKNNSFKKVQGPCGTPGNPCPDEFNRMVKKSSLPKSYKQSLRYSDAGVTDNNVRPVNIINAVKAENERRVSAIKSDPGYKALTQNKQARPVVNRVDQYLDRAAKKGTGFYIPTMKESEGLLNIGRKYVGSKNIMEDLSLWDKGQSLFQGWRLANKYPNLENVAKGYGLERDK